MKETISCEVYRELSLLQQDHMLGPHTQELMEEHRRTCPDCVKWEEQEVLRPVPDDIKILEKLREKNRWIRMSVLLLGTTAGFLLGARGNLFSFPWPLFFVLGACAALLFVKCSWQMPVLLACAAGIGDFLWLRFFIASHLAIGLLAKDALLTGIFCGIWCAMGVVVVRLAGKVSMNWPKRNKKK